MSERMPTVPCDRCGRLIGWVLTDRGKRMPIDPEPDERGNVFCEYQAGVLRATVLTKSDVRPPGLVFMPHFATCGRRVLTPKREPKPKREPAPDLFSGGSDER